MEHRAQTAQKFNMQTSSKGNILLVNSKFKYSANVSKFETYKEWRCTKRNKTKCPARFCGSLDDTHYWKHNPHHTCVDPPQDDLTQEELEERQKQIEIASAEEEVLTTPQPKTEAVGKEPKPLTGYNY